MSRVKQTLEGFVQVDTVNFISAGDQFEVSYFGDCPMGEEFSNSVKEVIIFPGVRKFLGGVGERLNNSRDEGP